MACRIRSHYVVMMRLLGVNSADPFEQVSLFAIPATSACCGRWDQPSFETALSSTCVRSRVVRRPDFHETPTYRPDGFLRSDQDAWLCNLERWLCVRLPRVQFQLVSIGSCQADGPRCDVFWYGLKQAAASCCWCGCRRGFKKLLSPLLGWLGPRGS